jgi:hypothetical protein
MTDEIVKIALLAMYYNIDIGAGEEEAMKAAMEAAYPLIRDQVLDEVATFIANYTLHRNVVVEVSFPEYQIKEPLAQAIRDLKND